MRLRALAGTCAALLALEAGAAWRDRADRARTGSAFVDRALLDPSDLARTQRIVVREKPQTRVVHKEEGFEIRRVAEADAPVRETVLTRGPGDVWTVASAFGLEADRAWMGQMLRDLSQGRLRRFVTADPALAADLGFAGTLVRLEDAAGRPLRQIEFGRKDGGETYQFVRIDGGDTFVARHEAEILGDPLAWIVSHGLTFPADAVQEVELPFLDPRERPMTFQRAKRGGPLQPYDAGPGGEALGRAAEAVLEKLLAEPVLLVAPHDHPAAALARRNIAARMRLWLFDGKRYEVGYGIVPSGAPALSAGMRNEDLSVIVIESEDAQDIGRRSAAQVALVHGRATTLGRLPRTRAALAAAAGARR